MRRIVRESSWCLFHVGLCLFGGLPLGLARGDEPAKPSGPILEFRILATAKHDHDAIEKAKARDVMNPPEGYRWVILGRTFSGTAPSIGDKSLTDAKAKWERDAFQEGTVECRGKNLGGAELTREFAIAGNTLDTLRLATSPKLFFQAIDSYRIKTGPKLVTSGAVGIREEKTGPGQLDRWVLIKLDPQNVTEKDLQSVYPTAIDRKMAVGFRFSRSGGKKFGELTAAHLPEDGGAFTYNLGIISDGALLSAPVLLTTIDDRGLIENLDNAKAESLIRRLNASRK